MIDEQDYLEAKRRIAAREAHYAREAMKTNIIAKSRNLWGYCDGMKECLKILEECIEEKGDQHSFEPVSGCETNQEV